MHLAILIVLVIPCLVRSTELTPKQIKEVLDAHNRYRGMVSPSSSNMRLMTWDSKVAEMAQTKANKCVYDHANKLYHPTLGGLGENIYITSGHLPNSRHGVDRAVFKWDEEKNYYDFEQNTCQPNKVCNHYTQIAWAKSHLVGCGIKYCSGPVQVPGGRTLTGSTLVFCEYSPAGNLREGFLFNKKLAHPYTSGPSCSSCPNSANNCVENMCHSSAVAPRPATNATTTASPTASVKITTPKIQPTDKVPEATTPKTEITKSTPKTTKPKPEITKSTPKTTKPKPKVTETTSAPRKQLSCFSCNSTDTLEECDKQRKVDKCGKEMQIKPEEAFVCITEVSKGKVHRSCSTQTSCDERKSSLSLSDGESVTCCSSNLCNAKSRGRIETDENTSTTQNPGGFASACTSSKLVITCLATLSLALLLG